MRYKFANFVDGIEVALNAWHFSRYGEKREGKLDAETMAMFMRDVDGWAHMFFCKSDEQAMDARDHNINYETLEVQDDERPQATV